MRPYETIGQPHMQRPYDTFGQPPMNLPDQAVHRLAQALESGDPRQVMMRLSAEHQGVQRQHPGNPQAAQMEMNRLTTAANQEALRYERSYGLQLVQLHPHRMADGRMMLGVGRFNGAGWEDWNPQANAWVRSDNQQTMAGPYAAPQVDRFAPVSPLLTRPAANAPYDWAAWNRSSANPADTAYGVNPQTYPDYRDRNRDRQYVDRDLDQAAYRDPERRYRTGLDSDDRVDRLYALERRIEQEQVQLQRMMEQLAAQEQRMAQMRPGYAGISPAAYQPYAPNYAGRPGAWDGYHPNDFHRRNPQTAYASQMAQWQQWQQWQQAQQYAQYQQYQPYPPQYTQYPQYAQYQQYQPYPPQYVMPPLLQLAMGGRHRGFGIGII